MSITIDGVTIVRDGEICPERIARLSTEQLENFLRLHALAANPETVVIVVVRALLAERTILERGFVTRSEDGTADTRYARVYDHRLRPVTVDATLFYAKPEILETRGSHGTLIRRPLEWFLRDLAPLAKVTHPDLMLCWIRDVLSQAVDASAIHLFTGAGIWRSLRTTARAHLVGEHGYQYLSLGFVEDPSPAWLAIGGRHFKVSNATGTTQVEDDRYAHDATKVQ